MNHNAKKKNKSDKDANKKINHKINGCTLFGVLPVYINIDEKDKDKIPELEEQCKKDVKIINTHEDEVVEKSREYYNEYLEDYAQKGEENPHSGGLSVCHNQKSTAFPDPGSVNQQKLFS